MKLSKSGKERIYNSKMCYHCDCLDGEDTVALYDLTECWDFQPDDFKDVVVLNGNEARRIYSLVEKYFKQNQIVCVDDITDRALYNFETQLDRLKVL